MGASYMPPCCFCQAEKFWTQSVGDARRGEPPSRKGCRVDGTPPGADLPEKCALDNWARHEYLALIPRGGDYRPTKSTRAYGQQLRLGGSADEESTAIQSSVFVDRCGYGHRTRHAGCCPAAE